MPGSIHPARVLAKGLLMCLVFEITLAALGPAYAGVNVYAALRLERERFPVSTLPAIDAALDVGNLPAMFASHIVSRPKQPNEYRVLVLGDSAVWGLQLSAEQTLPDQLDRMGVTCGDRQVRAYNLSFPRSSATKDLMILDEALHYHPDMIIWLITWYTLMPKTRLDHWLVTQNPEEFYKLGRRFDFLPKGYRPPGLFDEVLNDNRTLFRVTRYQLYSLVQAATRRDQIPGPPEIQPADLSADTTFEGLKPPTLRKAQVSLDQVSDFFSLSQAVRVLLVNEPMLVVSGVPNSDVRYNSYYPRWVYDQYRGYVREAAAENGWNYLDLWNAISPSYFTDTPLHLSPEGQRLLANALVSSIKRDCR